MSLNMWGKWRLTKAGERYLDSIELIIDDKSQTTKREAIAYFILDGIRNNIPLTAIQDSLTHIGSKKSYRLLQSSLENYERNRWVFETDEDYTEEELTAAEGYFSRSIQPPDIPKGFEDFKDHF